MYFNNKFTPTLGRRLILNQNTWNDFFISHYFFLENVSSSYAAFLFSVFVKNFKNKYLFENCAMDNIHGWEIVEVFCCPLWKLINHVFLFLFWKKILTTKKLKPQLCALFFLDKRRYFLHRRPPERRRWCREISASAVLWIFSAIFSINNEPRLFQVCRILAMTRR